MKSSIYLTCLQHITNTRAESRNDKIFVWWSSNGAREFRRLRTFGGQWLHLYGKSLPAEKQVIKTIAESDCKTGQYGAPTRCVCLHVHSLESFGAIEIQPPNTSSHPETKLSSAEKRISYIQAEKDNNKMQAAPQNETNGTGERATASKFNERSRLQIFQSIWGFWKALFQQDRFVN